MSTYKFFVSGPKFTNIISPYAAGVVVDHVLCRFSLCWKSKVVKNHTKFQTIYPYKF